MASDRIFDTLYLCGTVVAQVSQSRNNAMNWDTIEGNWKQYKGKAKVRWGKLTDDTMDVIAGKRDQLAGQIQKAYGVSKDEAEKQISDFEKAAKKDS